MNVMAALAAQQRRAHLLPRVLASLRPQVDRLAVYLNGWTSVPACVEQLADSFVLSPENLGAEKKFHWADTWDGYYCTVDDDIVYPADYVQRMTGAVRRLGGRVLATAHGRVFLGRPSSVHNVTGAIGHYSRAVSVGRLVNHGGTGVMAWDAGKLKLPTSFPQVNLADMQLAIWAQQNSVPMWLVAHEAHWLTSLAPHDPDGIYESSRLERHARRNSLLRGYGFRNHWQVFDV